MNNYLSNRQVAFIVFSAVVGFGIISLPKVIAETAGTTGWIVLAFSTIISIIFTYIITKLNYIHKGETIFEYSTKLVGKVFTYIFMLIYIFYFFSIFSLLPRASCEYIQLTILNRTPLWALSLLLLIVVFYALSKGITLIGRISELYGGIIILAIVFVHLLLLSKGHLVNLRPFADFSKPLELIKSLKETTTPLLGFEVVTILTFGENNNKNVVKYTTSTMAIIGLLYILIVESAISVIGVDDIIHYRTADLYAIRMLDIPYLELLRRLDGLYIITWTMALFTTLLIYGYSCSLLIGKCLHKENINMILLILSLIAYIISIMPMDFEMVLKMIGYASYLGMLTSAVIPTVLLLASRRKKYGKD